MLYRCVKCEREVDFGFWPSSGTHSVFLLYYLLCLLLGGFLVAVLFGLLRSLIGAQVAMPAWIGFPLGLVAWILATMFLCWLPELIEHRLISRRPCEGCGATRSWSWGYGRGMGL